MSRYYIDFFTVSIYICIYEWNVSHQFITSRIWFFTQPIEKFAILVGLAFHRSVTLHVWSPCVIDTLCHIFQTKRISIHILVIWETSLIIKRNEIKQSWLILYLLLRELNHGDLWILKSIKISYLTQPVFDWTCLSRKSLHVCFMVRPVYHIQKAQLPLIYLYHLSQISSHRCHWCQSHDAHIPLMQWFVVAELLVQCLPLDTDHKGNW